MTGMSRCDAAYVRGTVLASPTLRQISAQGKPPATAGRKAKGSRAARQPGCRRFEPGPTPRARERGVFVTREREFVSLASGSRAHDVGQAITPQGQLWGVCF